MLETILGQLESARVDSPAITNLTIGAPSYLQAALIPVLAGVLPDVKLRGVELPVSLLRANAEDERFDVLLLPSEPGHLPASWEAEEVGELRKALFGTPELLSSLGPGPISPDALIEIPFVCPVFRREGRIGPIADDCPLPQSRRRVGHEVMTFFVGLEVASATNQLVFGPAIAARRHVQTGALVEIPVAGWDVRDPLSFAYHVDRVSAKVRTAFADALRTAMPRSGS
jgi:DNA-binding transcriptional LysR family regulator